jgi:4-hydroxybutyryl-CoA dehydratase/vinylacetyl-CoA-Delta-isomerase
MLMSGKNYRESLKKYSPTIYLNGKKVDADDPSFEPGINAIALTYDLALVERFRPIMLADSILENGSSHKVNRLIAIPSNSDDLINKLEAVRLVCQETGCAQRYLGGDALASILENAYLLDSEFKTEYANRVKNYIKHVYSHDLTIAIAMTDAKGDRSKRPHQQSNPDSYVHIVERLSNGIRVSGTKAIVTGAPYSHELLVMPGRNMNEHETDFSVCFSTPIDAEGITIVARPAGRPGEKSALFSNNYGQSTAVVIFDNVFIPYERIFLNGEHKYAASIVYSYTSHHRHTCIAARAGFGDLLIGAGALMTEANGIELDASQNLRNEMIELIKIVEGFYACGVAASAYHRYDKVSNIAIPDAVFSNIGKLLLATQIYDMHRIAHHVSGGLIVTLPGIDEDHNPVTAGRLSDVLTANSDVPYEKRIEVARFIEDLTASYQAGWYSVISLHGGGSPEAMKLEIWRNYPVGNKVDLVEKLLGRGLLADQTRKITQNRQPGKCCDKGCMVPLSLA